MNSNTETTTPATVLLSPLRWYTGYYSLVGTGSETLPKGAFLQIISSGNQNSLFDITSIAISTDGTTVTTYTSGFTVDNVHNQITIPGAGSVTLSKNNNERAISSLQGTINSKTVAGVNYLSPAPLEILEGSYKNTAGKEILSIAQNPNHIAPVFNIRFDSGNGLQAIEEYTYDPTMYLLTFMNSAQKKYVLMLGTGEGKGLACFIAAEDPLKDTVLYTIPGGQ